MLVIARYVIGCLLFVIYCCLEFGLMIFGLLILVVLFILVDVVFWFKADLWGCFGLVGYVGLCLF